MFFDNSKKLFEHSKLNSGMWAAIVKHLHWWAALVDTGTASKSLLASTPKHGALAAVTTKDSPVA